MNRLIVIAVIAVIAVFAALPLPVAAQQFSMQEAGGVSWVCGGVGEEERNDLAALESKANLAVSFVTGKRGAYLSDVQMTLYDARAKSPRLDIQTDGPICLIHAAPGRYRIEASFGGTRRVATATVADGGKRPARVVIAFSEEP